MTSAEKAITRIKDDFEIGYDNLKNEKDRKNVIGLCEVIEKDVKAMRLIKRYFGAFIKKMCKEMLEDIKQAERMGCKCYNVHAGVFNEKEDIEKIKEYLENDK